MACYYYVNIFIYYIDAMNLNQISLPVKNLKKCINFYLKLGLVQIVDSPKYARFVCDINGSTFSLISNHKNFANGATIYFECKKLDKRVKQLQLLGIKFIQLPRYESYLWREAILEDPSGNKIKLYWAGKNRISPPWRIKKTLLNP